MDTALAIPNPPETRQIGKNNTGANLVGEGFTDRFWTAYQKTLPLFEGATVIPMTPGMGDVKVPVTKSAVAAQIVDEQAAFPNRTPDITFEDVKLTSYKYGTDLTKSSVELWNDSPVYAEEMLAMILSLEINRGVGAALMQGTGTNEPQGIATGAGDSGVSGISNVATWTTLMASVDPALWPTSAFVTHPQNLIAVMADPAFQNILDVFSSFGDMIQIIPTQNMPVNRLVFGDLRAFYVHRGPLEIVELQEPFAINGQVAHMAYLRIDSRVADDTSILYATIT